MASQSLTCLLRTISIVIAASIPAGQMLPVVAIFSGGFELGGASTYDGSVIVQTSIHMGQTVICDAVPCFWHLCIIEKLLGYISICFLAGQEVKDAELGNLGSNQGYRLRRLSRPCKVYKVVRFFFFFFHSKDAYLIFRTLLKYCDGYRNTLWVWWRSVEGHSLR
ncbi:hypothetical protein JB92DRAFT_849637 [Gautieria morchelliformis]|nr:hypothetical protein JB92DRAFT_849637 [Gautieria morchelliformis]